MFTAQPSTLPTRSLSTSLSRARSVASSCATCARREMSSTLAAWPDDACMPDSMPRSALICGDKGGGAGGPERGGRWVSSHVGRQPHAAPPCPFVMPAAPWPARLARHGYGTRDLHAACPSSATCSLALSAINPSASLDMRHYLAAPAHPTCMARACVCTHARTCTHTRARAHGVSGTYLLIPGRQQLLHLFRRLLELARLGARLGQLLPVLRLGARQARRGQLLQLAAGALRAGACRGRLALQLPARRGRGGRSDRRMCGHGSSMHEVLQQSCMDTCRHACMLDRPAE